MNYFLRITTLFLACFIVLVPSHLVAENKGKVKLVYVEWASEVVSTNVIKVVLEDIGYQVKIIPVSAAAMWESIAGGDADGLVAAWLNTTHGHYFESVKAKVEDLGPNLQGTRIGLVVPDYVPIKSVKELNQYADKLEGEIIGIDPGAGLMSKTEQVMKTYNLNKLKLVEGSGATMVAALSDAIKNNRWIVVTGWTPHWMFSRWKLKYIDEPNKIYDTTGHISTIVRKSLKEDMPEVYKILDRFSWTPSDMEQIMVWNEEKGADPYENAKRWVHEHPDKVKQWITP